MPENDIYNSKGKYEDFVNNGVKQYLLKPEERNYKKNNKAFYYCKNKINLKYFYKLFESFDARDISYIRRNRVLCTFRLICHVVKKDLKDLDRHEIDEIVTHMHQTHNSLESKKDFFKNIKRVWKVLFPEKDERGRIDENLTPYPVRHLKNNGDKSREKAKQDKLTWEEFESLMNFFSDTPCIQAYLSLAVESLGRPQEIVYTKIKDLELHDNYGKLNISEHGKEGIGFLQIMDSFPYILRWYKEHPLKKNKDAFLFTNNNNQQLTPKVINLKIKKACKHLKINKPVTAYSLKRNGVTFARLRGESDVEIQHKARWTSTRQLKTYDLSNIEDSFKIQLAKRGLIKDSKFKEFMPKTKNCIVCGEKNIGFNEELCPKCLRSLDREKIKKEAEFLNIETMQELVETVNELKKEVEKIKCLD